MAEDAEDTPEDGADGEAEGGAKKGGMKKLILFVGLPVVILLLAGVAGALLFLGGGEDEAHVAEGEHGEHAEGGEHGEHAEVAAADAAASYYERAQSWEPPEPFTLNIADAEGRTVTMVVNLAIIYTDPAVGEMLNNPQVEMHFAATILEFLRTLRTEDLDGSMGHFRVRAEMLRRTNLVIAPKQADDVLILNMVMG